MAKKKTKVLWLSRERTRYHLWFDKPVWYKKDKEFYCADGGIGVIYGFCANEFEPLFPSLKLRKNTKCKLKLTQLKNGIKLEKVK